jgi:Lon protease-like protein
VYGRSGNRANPSRVQYVPRMATREIGIFALPTVLVPGERMPLHIFEDRYKRLIADCLEAEEDFLLLYTDEDGTREIGCGARVEEVLDRLEDGRMNIVVEGTEVLQVTEITRGRMYTSALVEPAADDLSTGEETGPVLDLYRQIAATGGGDPDEDLLATGAPLSYAIMARVDFPAAEKQRVLELRAESERLMAIVDLLARGLQALAQIEEIRERAQTNGKVPHGD